MTYSNNFSTNYQPIIVSSEITTWKDVRDVLLIALIISPIFFFMWYYELSF